MRQARTWKIDELVKLYLKRSGIGTKLKEMEAREAWPVVVGQAIAGYTSDVEMKDGRMVVRLTSAVVRNELGMVKEGIIRALNDRLGEEVVQDIVFR